ncbi:hypothetical protein POM88_016358 [Heracleum sosnowskyi]|uniref:F-box protein n=1 Tax=Heracleum sosnowskyi TaxID=360622 RepID=A0AAD8IQF8_9APIA|nr:hypothetical protein POM88_016358 [Heracleum sosnowskyi]
MAKGGLKNETLDHIFQKLMVVAGCGGGMKMGGGRVITEWKDILMELLLRIVSLVDDRSVIVASGAIRYNCTQLQYLNLGWCENVGDIGVMCLAYGYPDLRILYLCGFVLVTGIVRETMTTYVY